MTGVDFALNLSEINEAISNAQSSLQLVYANLERVPPLGLHNCPQ